VANKDRFIKDYKEDNISLLDTYEQVSLKGESDVTGLSI
jgi:hypothetical protein